MSLSFLYADNHHITDSFTYINWNELCVLAKIPIELEGRTIEEAKPLLPVIAANDAPNKTKEAVLAHNNFTLLRLDLDDTDLSINDVYERLLSIGLESFIIHTSASHLHNGKGNRYRVFIQIASSVTYEVWSRLESYLSYLFSADDCAARPQQIMYAPLNTPSYDCRIKCGLSLDVESSQLLNDANVFKAEQEAQLLQAQEAPVKPQYEPKLIGKQVSIIDAVNEAYDWSSLLSSFGYKRQGKAWLPPESTSGAAGAYILTSHTDGKERYFSHHDNDPCSTGRSIDKFDFITIRMYSGNSFQALKEIAKSAFPEVHKHNQEEYFTAKHNGNMSTTRTQYAEVN